MWGRWCGVIGAGTVSGDVECDVVMLSGGSNVGSLSGDIGCGVICVGTLSWGIEWGHWVGWLGVGTVGVGTFADIGMGSSAWGH